MKRICTFSDGLWTAYITLTTIGYGDVSAATPQGRWVTVLTSMLGIGCFGILTGVILERAMQRRIQKMKGEGKYIGKGHLIIVNVPSYAETTELMKELDHSPDFKDIPRVLVTAQLPNQDKEIPHFFIEKTRRIHNGSTFSFGNIATRQRERVQSMRSHLIRLRSCNG